MVSLSARTRPHKKNYNYLMTSGREHNFHENKKQIVNTGYKWHIRI